MVIGHCVPDFANCDGKKEVIELFGDYWHTKKEKMYWHYTELGRIMAYNSFGYNCLIIWEHELNDSEAVVSKIKQFTKHGRRVKCGDIDLMRTAQPVMVMGV